MRIVLASLLATAALASVAQAQTPSAPAAPAAQTPPDATAAAPPATPTPPATPDANAAPAQSPTDEARAKLAALTGDGAQVLQIVEKFCVPLVRGGNFDQLAKANGMKNNRRDGTWSIQLGTTKGLQHHLLAARREQG